VPIKKDNTTQACPESYFYIAH